MATDKETFLYKITNPKGRIYIGQTVNLIDRLRVYRRNAIPAQHRLRSSISKYGWDSHKAEVITTVSNSSADYAEKYLIAYYNATGKKGLNILHGGKIRRTPEMNAHHSKVMKGKKQSKEQIEKRSISLRGNVNAKGSVRDNKFRENASKKLLGFKRPDTTNYKKPRPSQRKPVLCYTKDGVFIKEYARLRDVKLDGFSFSSAGRVCSGIYSQHKGLIFKFKKDG